MQVKNILSAVGIILLAAGCNNVDFQKTKGGMPYKLFASKNGKKIDSGTIVKAHVLQKIKDSVVMSSYTSMPVYFPVQPSQASYDISEVFLSLKEGDSVYAAQVMDTFIKRNPEIVRQTNYKNGDQITTSIKILKVFGTQQEAMKDEETERTAFANKEQEAVKDYIKKKNINAQPVGKGTYVEILEPGSGPNIDSGKYVTVKYKGQTFSGIVFDSNIDSTFGHTEPMGFTVGTVGPGGMIKGFDDGIQLLKKGGKGRFYIPSMLAYGPQPPSKDIKPFENLIFEVEVLDILDKAPAQPQMQQPVDPRTQIPK